MSDKIDLLNEIKKAYFEIDKKVKKADSRQRKEYIKDGTMEKYIKLKKCLINYNMI